MKIKQLEFGKNNDALILEFDEVKYQTVGDISKYFTKNKTDILIITKNKKPFFVLTSTDIIDALVAHNDDVDVMTFINQNPKKIITINENDTVFEAYRLMRTYKIHHLIVVDDEGVFKNIINFYDFASYLTEMALKDELTGLYNKRFFEFILDRYKEEDEIEIGILFIDLDNFKQINDKYGHLFGDKVLREIALIIKQSIRDMDYAFRFGGDEFVILIFSEFNVLEKVASRIENRIENSVIEGVKAMCSIGYAHRPTDSEDLQEVLRIADERMYEKKRRVKN